MFAGINYDTTISYFSNWLNNDIDASLTLYGLKIYWWNRIGNILQFVGGFTILAEIFKENILISKKHISEVITFDFLKKIVSNATEYIKINMKIRFSYLIKSEKAELKAIRRKFKFYRIIKFITIVIMVISVICVEIISFINMYNRLDSPNAFVNILVGGAYVLAGSFAELGVLMIVALLFDALIVPFVVICSSLPILIVLGIFELVILEPVALFLEFTTRERAFKFLGFLLFVIGFTVSFLTTT